MAQISYLCPLLHVHLLIFLSAFFSLFPVCFHHIISHTLRKCFSWLGTYCDMQFYCLFFLPIIHSQIISTNVNLIVMVINNLTTRCHFFIHQCFAWWVVSLLQALGITFQSHIIHLFWWIFMIFDWWIFMIFELRDQVLISFLSCCS